MATVTAGQVTLRYELRGNRPPVPLIAGATGDGSLIDTTADALAEQFTVITYDRRGNSHSSRPQRWSATCVEEQAADAAGLRGALGLVPAAVFGTSSGAIYALSLLLRHPDIVEHSILHEPPLLALLRRPTVIQTAFTSLIENAMASGGPKAAVARFWCLLPAIVTGQPSIPTSGSGCSGTRTQCSRSSSERMRGTGPTR